LFLDLFKKSKGFPIILAFSEISQNCFCIGKIMDRVYGSRDHGWHSVHGGFMTMGRAGPSGAQEVIVIARREGKRERERENERERGGHQSSHQWCHLEAELRR
jgi:hypothetical protein